MDKETMMVQRMMLTDKEFFKEACRWKGSESEKSAATWWSAFVEVIIHELFVKGLCRMPGIGAFTVELKESKTFNQPLPGGGYAKYTAPARIIPIFTPQDDFINDINMQGVTKAYRKRLRKGELKSRDYERELRAEAMQALANVEEMLAEKKEEAQVSFQKLLMEKRQKNKETKSKIAERGNIVCEVEQLDEEENVLAVYPNITAAAKATGIDKTAISCVCTGRFGRQRAGGYKWRFIKKQDEQK